MAKTRNEKKIKPFKVCYINNDAKILYEEEFPCFTPMIKDVIVLKDKKHVVSTRVFDIKENVLYINLF